MTSQSKEFKKYLSEIVIYGSSITFNDLYNMPIDDIKIIEEVITNKIKDKSKDQYL